MKNFDHITITVHEYFKAALISYSFGNERFGTHIVGLNKENIEEFVESPTFIVRNDGPFPQDYIYFYKR